MAGTACLDLPNASAPQSRIARVNAIELHYLEQGTGEPLLLLHGFPDHAAAWRPLFERMDNSFRLLAPDQRGYRQTSRPLAVSDYGLDFLVGDLVALLDSVDLARAHVCGHDWGGVLAFELAARFPERVGSIIALNAPPPGVLQDMIWHDPGQRAASQYISFLRSPAADKTLCEANVDGLIDRFLGDARHRGLLSECDVAAYRDAWTQPGVWQAMLAWYRAAPFDVPEVAAPVPGDHDGNAQPNLVDCPVLVIWGDRDTVFVPAMADAIARASRNCRVERLAGAGHSPHRDDADACAALIRGFIAQNPLPPVAEE